MLEKHKKVDRRIIKTKQSIFDAFTLLLSENELSKITISALAREANIDRKTFYLHYSSINEMLDDMAYSLVSDIMDESVKELNNVLKQHENNPLYASPSKRLLLEWQLVFHNLNITIMQRLNEDRSLVGRMPTELLLERFRKPLEEEIFSRELINIKAPREIASLYVSCILGGIIGVYVTWLDSEQETPLSVVSSVAENVIFLGLGGLIDHIVNNPKTRSMISPY